MQIWQHNIRHRNVIAMKRVIISKKTWKKKGQLIVKNANKIVHAKVAKTLGPINLDGKYIRVISNINIDAA